MNIDDSPESLPGCLGFFELPMPPNGPCNKCPCAEMCKHLVRKEEIKAILVLVEEIKNILGGEKRWERSGS